MSPVWTQDEMEPTIGLEPMTCALRMGARGSIEAIAASGGP